MHCKSLWIKVSAKCINVNVNVADLSQSVQDRASGARGLMSQIIASPVVQLGLLHMRPFQVVNQEPEGFTSLLSGDHCKITVTCKGYLALKPWKRPQFLQKRVQLGACLRRKTITTDASLMGWVVVHQGCSVRGIWSEKQRRWHINRLELLAV